MSTVRVPLSAIAHGRSGDKGNHANVAVLAYTAAGYDWLRANLTAEVVGAYFAPLGGSRVERFEAANVFGLNFVLYDALAGGASLSLRSDTQGKTLAVALLMMPVELPADHTAMLRAATPLVPPPLWGRVRVGGEDRVPGRDAHGSGGGADPPP